MTHRFRKVHNSPAYRWRCRRGPTESVPSNLASSNTPRRHRKNFWNSCRRHSLRLPSKVSVFPTQESLCLASPAILPDSIRCLPFRRNCDELYEANCWYFRQGSFLIRGVDSAGVGTESHPGSRGFGIGRREPWGECCRCDHWHGRPSDAWSLPDKLLGLIRLVWPLRVHRHAKWSEWARHSCHGHTRCTR